MLGERLAAGAFMVAGLAAAALGGAPFVSPRFRRFYLLMWTTSPWTNGPAASAASVAVGIGIFLVGLALVQGNDAFIYAGLAAMVGGAVIYVSNPSWLKPGWMKRS